MHDIRIALIVMNCPLGRADDNLRCMGDWIRAARREGAAIVCFPELGVTGYGVGPEMARWALPLAGAVAEALTGFARSENVVVLAGMAEKADGDRIFATQVVVGPRGVSGVYRKVHVGPPERDILSPGDRTPLFVHHGITFGIQLCYDAHFPELTTRQALDGAELVFMPHASPRGTPSEKLASWMRHLPARAFDNGLFVASCNQSGDNGQGLMFPGTAAVLGPSGKLLYSYTRGGEGLLLADLKAADLSGVRGHRMSYFLPHRRPTIYRRRRAPGEN
jgi:predicted amidohydrolase